MSSALQALQAWTEALKTKTEVSLARATRYKGANEATSGHGDPYSVGNCIDVLEKMEGYDDSQYFLAMEKLTNSEAYHQSFIHMSELRRQQWVIGMK